MRALLTISLLFTILLTNCQETKYFGESFETTDAITVDELVGKLEASGSAVDAVVTGTVEDVCQVKGCWMTLKLQNGESMRVTFKDYGFFVPKDIHEKTVIIKGNGSVTVTSVEDLRHYAGDEGQSAEEIAAITEPLEEYVFVADGVYIE